MNIGKQDRDSAQGFNLDQWLEQQEDGITTYEDYTDILADI